MRRLTRAEYEARLDTLRLRCRGPRVRTPRDVLADLMARLDRLPTGSALRAERHARAVDLASACADVVLAGDTPTYDAVVTLLLARGQHATAQLLDRLTRDPCGYDVAALIRAAPYDGAEHAAPCPRCGTRQYWVPELAGSRVWCAYIMLRRRLGRMLRRGRTPARSGS